jgi:hypothetical protein
MNIPLDTPTYAGQASSASADIGTAVSARKGDTPSQGTSQRSLRIKSSASLEKGSSHPASKGVPLPKSMKGKGHNADGKGEWGSRMDQFYYGNRLQFGGLKTENGGARHQAQVLRPLECTIADKLTRHGTDRDKRNTTTSTMGAESRLLHTCQRTRNLK